MHLDLPIYSILDKLLSAFETHKNVILTSAPGTGKSTVVPIFLLQTSNLFTGKIILVQPRRLAVRSVANRLSASLGEKTGETIGYRMRMDTRVSKQTRIEVLTEGVLLKALQQDPELSNVDLIIFDEVHERSLTCDLCLSLCLDIQQSLRDDLRLLAMSATVDASIFISFLPDSTQVKCDSPMFPVAVYYRPCKKFSPQTSDYLKVVLEAHEKHSANILVFLPGLREIRQLERQLLSQALCYTDIVCLFGGLSIQEQQQAIQVPIDTQRKIVLATSIAETSLTIEGISVVIDGGLNRYQHYNPSTGMNSMLTGKNSLASADQRKGRAGRLAPGDCYRLWAQSDRREHYNKPEILGADLAPLALNLAQWGVTNESDLSWLTPPPATTLSAARELLTTIGAIDDKLRITAVGNTIQNLGLHPRIGKMLCLTSDTASFFDACLLSGILNESGSIRFDYKGDDLEQLLRFCKSPSFTRTSKGTHLSKLAHKLYSSGIQNNHGRKLATGEMLALAYPDRIAQKRKGSRAHYKMANGRGAALVETSSLLNTPYIVISELDSRKGNAKIFQASSIAIECLERLFVDQIKEVETTILDEASGVFLTEQQSRLNALVLSSRRIASPDSAARSLAMCQYVRQKGLSALNWSDECRTWQARIRLVNRNLAISPPSQLVPLPNVEDDTLLLSLENWLAPWLNNISSVRALQKLDIRPALNNFLNWEQKKFVDQEAPTHYRVASGSKIKLNYNDHDMPVLAARIQELFSTSTNPTICGGRQNILIHLLSPGRRPVQITSDLIGFWQSSYFEVKKEMKGRYPKHHWPDDPANTKPHSSVRPK